MPDVSVIERLYEIPSILQEPPEGLECSLLWIAKSPMRSFCRPLSNVRH